MYVSWLMLTILRLTSMARFMITEKEFKGSHSVTIHSKYLAVSREKAFSEDLIRSNAYWVPCFSYTPCFLESQNGPSQPKTTILSQRATIVKTSVVAMIQTFFVRVHSFSEATKGEMVCSSGYLIISLAI